MLEPEIRLRQSIIDGNLLVVKRLLKRFPDLLENIDPLNGWSSLHYASFNGRYLVCVYLISLGHDKNETSKTFKNNTCVHLSLMNGHEQTTHLLLQHFQNLLNNKGENGFTPLHVSALKDYFKCVEMLLSFGADINAIDDEGNNALHISMKYNSLNTIGVLLNANIDVDCLNNAGLKPVDVAASFQTESYYNNLLKSSLDDSLVTPKMNTISSFDDSSPSSLTITKQRSHSNSLPPLPSVTTMRRPSVSSITRSPVPARSAISSEFNGSNSSSYIYSPTQSITQQQQQQTFAGLTIKPPTLGMTKSSSPTLYSPTNSALFPTIREGSQQSISFNSLKSNKTTQSLKSFPSMSSLNSGNERKTPTENRTRANSSINGTPQSINFVSISKTRSNSGGDQQQNAHTLILPQRKAPGKISPSNNSALTLSRSSTNNSAGTVSTATESENEYTHHSQNSNNSSIGSAKKSNSGFFSSDNDNESIRSKLSTKFESVANSYRKKTASSNSSPVNSAHSSRRNSILNIHISSLGRRKDV